MIALLFALTGCGDLPQSYEMGTARYPDDVSDSRVHTHAFTMGMDSYAIGYGLSEAGEEDVLAAAQDWMERWEQVVWPPGCDRFFQCVYEASARYNTEPLKPLADRFRVHAASRDLDTRQVTELVVQFVQGLPYKTVDEAFSNGLIPPALVAWHGHGDCDSKSLLAVLLLTALGIDSMILSSQHAKHALFGVAIPAPGSFFMDRGRRYAVVESTSRWPIGRARVFDEHDDWVAMPLRAARSTLPEHLDLGRVVVPPDATDVTERELMFEVDGPWPTGHRLRMAVERTLLETIGERAHRFGRETQFVRLESGGFRWYPTTGCKKRAWPCILQRFDRDNRDVLAPLARHIVDADRGLGDWDLAARLVGPLHTLEYTDDRSSPFMLAPAVAIMEGRTGHTTSVLAAYVLFAEAGLDVVFLTRRVSGAFSIGVAVAIDPSPYEAKMADAPTLQHDGKTYVMALPPHHRFGQAPDTLVPAEWTVMPYSR